MSQEFLRKTLSFFPNYKKTENEVNQNEMVKREKLKIKSNCILKRPTFFISLYNLGFSSAQRIIQGQSTQ